ncbi:MAG: hypothetical protein B6D61_05665 [Bacteroidetes bacterium 4484_249]|nr:MAG: hypothetical protein B6D61_05665 [Bacteroidetes bacterium 4484_249]
MKTLLKITVVLMALLPATLSAQKSPVDKLFDKYSGEDGFTSVDIAKGLFELFSDIEADDPEFDSFKKAVEGIESLKLLAYSVKDGSEGSKQKFYNDIKKSVPYGEYDELMVIKDKDARINFYAKSDKQVITEMLMVVDGDDKAVLLSLIGNIDLNNVAKLGSSMNLEGMEYLGKMKRE